MYVISTLLYGSESWTMRAHQEKVECASHALPQMYAGNHMAGQGDNLSGTGKGWDTKLIHSLKAKAHAMADM